MTYKRSFCVKLMIMENNGSLYYCKTARQLLCALLLAKQEPKTKEKYLCVNAWLLGLFPRLKESICSEEWNFKKIFLYNTGVVTDKNNDDERVFLDDIVKYYDALLSSNNINIDNISSFNLFSSLRFSLYLILKNKKFNLFEDSNGSAEKNGLVQWRQNIDKVNKTKIASDYGLMWGESDFVEGIYSCSGNNKKFPKNKIVHFSVQSAMENLSDHDLKDIYSILSSSDTDALNEQSYDYIILSQYYGLSGKLTGEYFWAVMADAFIPENSKFAIKPHPADNTNYDSCFGKHEIINKNIPFELIEKTLTMKNTISVSSTAVALSNVNAIKLGEEYIEFDVVSNNAVFYLLSLMCNHAIGKVKYVGEHVNIAHQIIKNKYSCNLSCVDTAPDITVYEKISDYKEACCGNGVEMVLLTKADVHNFFNNEAWRFVSLKAKHSELPFEEFFIGIKDKDNALDVETFLPCELKMKYSGISVSIARYSALTSLREELTLLKKDYNKLHDYVQKIETKLNSMSIEVKFK